MHWPISQIVKASGVTSRTLRHYHAIGLLKPASVAGNGRRMYGPEELLRLQQILLLKELDLDLATIGRILDGPSHRSSRQILGRHRDRLMAEQQRLAKLAQTVDKTIEALEEGKDMSPDAMFEGFDSNPYEQDARERWGDEAVDASYARIKKWSPADGEQAKTGFDRVHAAIAEHFAAGAGPGDDAVQRTVAFHHEIVSLFWVPNAEAYRGLGQMYVDDARFRQNIGKGNDAVVEFLRDAINIYADQVLAKS